MKTAVITLLLLVTISLLTTTMLASKLKMVVVYHRHGARNTLHNFGKTPIEIGQLTAVGMRQLYLLGREFRKKYIDEAKLLPESYDPATLYVRSTAVNRTLQSAQAFLAGLYPNGTGLKFNETYPLDRAVPPISHEFNYSSFDLDPLPAGFQPIPVHSVFYNKDFLLHAYEAGACPNMVPTTHLAKSHDNYTVMWKAFNETYQGIVEALNLNNKNPSMSDMSGVSDYLFSSYMANQPTEVPVGSELWLSFMLSKNISGIYLHYSTRYELNVFTTKMFEELLHRMDNLISNKSRVSFVEYSAHDYTVNMILAYMNITGWQCLFDKYVAKDYSFDPKCPFSTEVGGSFTLELYEQDNGTHTVKMLYNSDVYPMNGKMEIPYDEFAAVLRSTMVNNFFELCLGVKEENLVAEAAPSSSPTWRVIILVIQGIIILALIGLCLKTKNDIASVVNEKRLLPTFQ